MRKTIFSLMFAIMFGMTLGSCGNGAAVAATDVDSTVVDSAVVDSTVVDTDTVALDSVVAAE